MPSVQNKIYKLHLDYNCFFSSGTKRNMKFSSLNEVGREPHMDQMFVVANTAVQFNSVLLM